MVTEGEAGPGWGGMNWDMGLTCITIDTLYKIDN